MKLRIVLGVCVLELLYSAWHYESHWVWQSDQRLKAFEAKTAISLVSQFLALMLFLHRYPDPPSKVVKCVSAVLFIVPGPLVFFLVSGSWL
jgi:hypothetical protein